MNLVRLCTTMSAPSLQPGRSHGWGWHGVAGRAQVRQATGKGHRQGGKQAACRHMPRGQAAGGSSSCAPLAKGAQSGQAEKQGGTGPGATDVYMKGKQKQKGRPTCT